MAQKNHLAQETSPYLQQHVNNPVDWYPWNKASLEKARQENKPILLSIGYAACHWCHVMAHESFEDEETANVMNTHFVNIKVDREERPDLDKVYQTAHFFLTKSSGGWPLTLFLTPDDLIPFFSGTYFPRDARYQLPSFKDVLRTLAEIYQAHPNEIKKQNQQLYQALNQKNPDTINAVIDNKPLELGFANLKQKFDTKYGGFGSAPKFPNPTKIEFLLLDKSPLASRTLQHMADGGIYDQLQGGFFRYSVDEKWQIPHFEKMLYDNAQLLLLYTLGSQQFNNPYFAKIARETANWVMTIMQSPEGGYYSSIDADSEGHEGKFYIWDKPIVEKILTSQEIVFANLYFGLSEKPNFENHWHLHVSLSCEIVAKQLNIAEENAKQILASIKQKLLTERQKRITPGIDKKILTSWNSLMIKAMAIAGSILKEPSYIASAQRALHCIQKNLWRDHRLLASYKDDKAQLNAYLDDYAYLLDALLTLLQIDWNLNQLEFARELAENLLTHFYDPAAGGFFFTANDHEALLYRPKTMMDEAMPSGNSVAIRALLSLDHLLGETRYFDVAQKTLQSAWPALLHYPDDHCSMLLALNQFLESVQYHRQT